MRTGFAYRRRRSAPLTAEIVGGASPGTESSWATPSARDWRSGNASDETMQKNARPLNEQASHWPTPRSTDADHGGPNQRDSAGKPALPAAAAKWPTPSASVANDGESPETWRIRQAELKAKGINGNGAGVPLTIAAIETMGKLWPTPHGHGGKDHTGKLGAGGEFEKFVNNWPTPQAADGERQSEQQMRGNPTLLGTARRFWSTPLGSEPRQGYKGGSQYQQSLSTEAVDFLSGPQDRTTEQPGKPSSRSGRGSLPQLSALFEEWLMGLPLGWTCVCAPEGTDFEDSATPSCPSKPKQPCACSGSAPSESTCEVQP